MKPLPYPMPVAPYIPPALITLATVVGVFLLILAVLWCILPFAIFGVKGKLDAIRQELIAIKEGMKSE